MTETPDIHGVCPDRFSAVREAFTANFTSDQELGARFSAVLDGEVVIDLWAGWADRDKTRAFDETTLAPVFSTGKAVVAIMMARLVGQGLLAYDQFVAEVWPEFAHAGKAAITVEQCLSHADGLAAFVDPVDPQIWFDWDATCAHIAEMAPLWPPATASGYSPVIYGYLAGEIFRRADGRSIGAALRQDVAGPLGLDIWIGLPESEDGRVAEIKRPPAPPDLGEITPLKRAAFLEPWSSPNSRDLGQWRRAEIPAANCHATALDLARLVQSLAVDGRVEHVEVIGSGLGGDAMRERISGPDLVLPFDLSWGAGLLRNERVGIYGPGQATAGHSGWGGSCVMADPEKKLSAAYVMNRQSIHIIGDPRPTRLIEAIYEGLG